MKSRLVQEQICVISHEFYPKHAESSGQLHPSSGKKVFVCFVPNTHMDTLQPILMSHSFIHGLT